MGKKPLAGLTVRTGAVRDARTGYILACDIKLEQDEVPHAVVFKWSSGVFRSGKLNFDAHTCCLISVPLFALVMLSHTGDYGISTETSPFAGEIFEDSQPPPLRSGYVGFRSLSEISGKAYAVGLRGMVYRLDEIKKWTRIDYGLPATFDIQTIHGFDPSDIYAVGRNGQVWHYNGQEWNYLELPTSMNLTAVKCGEDGIVYIVGHNGLFIRGRNMTWGVIDQEDTKSDIWDIEWFQGEVYASTMSKVYTVQKERLVPVNFGDDVPGTCYQISMAEEVMWSIGEEDIMSFDGKNWTRIV